MGQSGDNAIGMIPNGSAELAIQQVLAESDFAVPGQTSPANNVLAIHYEADRGGYAHVFTDGLNAVTQDWSAYNALGMWLYANGDGDSVDVTLYGADNASYQYTLTDTQAGWRYYVAPFALFEATDDNPPFDPAKVSGYGVAGAGANDAALYIDDVALFTVENTATTYQSADAPQYTYIVDESVNWESRDWSLLWSDEFDGPAGATVNPDNWTCEVGGNGWGNNELEYYTDCPENAALNGEGFLQIVAPRGQPENGETCWYGQCAFTSARLITHDKVEFTYGRVEARLQIPFGQGIWPAFWMLGANFSQVGWPNSGEIDIMENIGSEPQLVHGTIHGPGYSGAGGIGNSYADGSDFADDFHVYAIEWDPNVIRWYVDGNLYSVISVNELQNREWVYDHDFFIIMNIAIGGAWPGSPNDSTTFPQQMLVDYVRVYQLAP
jgi:beta-glucanase (GH16 family)